MENWKRAVLAGSAGLSVICLLKGSRTGGVVFAGVALATLASEYPDEFARFRRKAPEYVERATTFLEVASQVGERIAYLAERRNSAWYEALLNG
jgi:hypothetical protein